MNFALNSGDYLTVNKQPEFILKRDTKNHVEFTYNWTFPSNYLAVKCKQIKTVVVDNQAVAELINFYVQVTNNAAAITNNSNARIMPSSLNIQSETTEETDGSSTSDSEEDTSEGGAGQFSKNKRKANNKPIKVEKLAFTYGNQQIFIDSCAELENNSLLTWDKNYKAVFKKLQIKRLKRIVATGENETRNYGVYWLLFYAKVKRKLLNERARSEFIFTLSDPFGYSVHSTYNSKTFQPIIFFKGFGFQELLQHLYTNIYWPEYVLWSKLAIALNEYCSWKTGGIYQLSANDLLYLRNRLSQYSSTIGLQEEEEEEEEGPFISFKMFADKKIPKSTDKSTFGVWFYEAMELLAVQFCIKPVSLPKNKNNRQEVSPTFQEAGFFGGFLTDLQAINRLESTREKTEGLCILRFSDSCTGGITANVIKDKAVTKVLLKVSNNGLDKPLINQILDNIHIQHILLSNTQQPTIVNKLELEKFSQIKKKKIKIFGYAISFTGITSDDSETAAPGSSGPILPYQPIAGPACNPNETSQDSINFLNNAAGTSNTNYQDSLTLPGDVIQQNGTICCPGDEPFTNARIFIEKALVCLSQQLFIGTYNNEWSANFVRETTRKLQEILQDLGTSEQHNQAAETYLPAQDNRSFVPEQLMETVTQPMHPEFTGAPQDAATQEIVYANINGGEYYGLQQNTNNSFTPLANYSTFEPNLVSPVQNNISPYSNTSFNNVATEPIEADDFEIMDLDAVIYDASVMEVLQGSILNSN